MWDIFNLEVIFLEVSMPSGGAMIKISWRFPVLKIGMVGLNDKRFFCPS